MTGGRFKKNKKFKNKTDAEQDDDRRKINPFAEHDDNNGVDLDDPISPRNSFLSEEQTLDRDWDDTPEDDTINDDEDPDNDW